MKNEILYKSKLGHIYTKNQWQKVITEMYKGLGKSRNVNTKLPENWWEKFTKILELEECLENV
jgi:hypothetical protein